jgi:hypothetical protein
VVDDDSSWGGEYLGLMSRSSLREVATASPGTKRCWSFIRWPKEQAGGGGGWQPVEQADGETRERERERHATRMGAVARTPFLHCVEGVAENEEAVCVLR